MKFNFRKKPRRPSRRLDITPLIDVVFLLLIFFMLTSNYVLQAGIKIDLPTAVDTFTVPVQRVEIFITRDDRIFCQGSERTPDELFMLLKRTRTSTDTILVFADVDCRHGRVVQIEDICQRSGYKNINIATKPVEEIFR